MIKAFMHRVVWLPILAMMLSGCTKTTPQKRSESECEKLKDLSVMHESQRAHVTRVADGDTFTACLMPGMIGSVKVRVLGIDCPEISENQKCKKEEKQGKGACKNQIPLGKKAGEIAKRTLLNQNIYLESAHGNGSFEKDIFGRVLAYVRTTAGEDFGKKMVLEGFCENYQWKYPHPRGIEYGFEKAPPLQKRQGRM